MCHCLAPTNTQVSNVLETMKSFSEDFHERAEDVSISSSCPPTQLSSHHPLVWAFASTATSLSKVAPAGSPVGFAHVFLGERKRNRCGTKDFVLNPFPWNFFGPPTLSTEEIYPRSQRT